MVPVEPPQSTAAAVHGANRPRGGALASDDGFLAMLAAAQQLHLDDLPLVGNVLRRRGHSGSDSRVVRTRNVATCLGSVATCLGSGGGFFASPIICNAQLL